MIFKIGNDCGGIKDLLKAKDEAKGAWLGQQSEEEGKRRKVDQGQEQKYQDMKIEVEGKGNVPAGASSSQDPMGSRHAKRGGDE